MMNLSMPGKRKICINQAMLIRWVFSGENSVDARILFSNKLVSQPD
jgi:hypothetical protein